MKDFLLRFFHNFVKELRHIIFALLLAIIVWFAISMQVFPDIVSHVDGIEVTVTPTEYMTENHLSLTEEFNETVSVRITGKRYDIGNLTSEDFTATLDLSSVTDAGEYVVGVQVTPVGNYVNCEIDDSELTAKITVEKIISKTFSVDEGTLTATADDAIPAENMKIESVIPDPGTITLTGDSAMLDRIAKVEIRSVLAGEIANSMSTKGEIVYIGLNGEVIDGTGITASVNSFNVSITTVYIKTLPLTINFTNVPDNFNLESLKYTIYPENLTISSPDSSIEAQDNFEVGTIDLSQLTTKYLQRLSLPINLPEGYTNISGNATAMISFDSDDYTFLNFAVQKENIRIVNAPTDFDVDILTNELSVTVTGPEVDIAALTSNDIYATLDFMGTTLTPGVRDITPEFTLRGARVKAWVTGEYKVSVEVNEKPEETESPES